MKISGRYILIIVLLFSISCNRITDEQRKAIIEKNRIPIEDFFRSPQQTGYKISPDGKYLAYRNPVNGISNIFIREIGKTEPIQLTHSKDRDIMRFFWGNANYLLYMQDNAGEENYKLCRINIDSGAIDCLTDFTDVKVSIVDQLEVSADEIIISMNRRFSTNKKRLH